MPVKHSGFEVSHCPIDDTLELIGLRRMHFYVILMCASSYFAAGAEFMILAFIGREVQRDLEISITTFASIASISAAVAFSAGLIFGRFADKFGRRLPFLTAQIFVCIFGLGCALAPNFGIFLFCRCAVAVGLGGLQAIDYILLLEIVPPSKKAFCGQLVFFAGCVGLVFLAALNLWLPESLVRWRILTAAAALATVPSLILRMFMNFETPRWLLAAGRISEAREILVKFAGDPKLVPQDLKISSQPTCGFSEIFSGQFKRVTFPLASIWIVQGFVFSGSSMFMKEVLTQAATPADLIYFALAVAELPGVIAAGIISHKISRAFTLRLFYSLATIAASSAALAAFCGSQTWLAVAVCAFYGLHVPCWGLLFLLTPECYPSKLKATAVGFVSVGKQLAAIAGPMVSQILVKNQDPGMFMTVWASILAGGALCAAAWLRVPSRQNWL